MPFSDYLQKLAPTSLKRALGSLFFKGIGEGFDGSADGVVRDDSGNPLAYHIDSNGLYQSGAPAADYGIVARIRAAVKARFPDNPVGATTATDDALAAIGGDRLLERGNNDTTQTWATRLRTAWAVWVYGGTAYGLLSQLWMLGYQNVHLTIVNGVSYTLRSYTGDPNVDLVIAPLMATSWWPNPGLEPARRWWTRFAVIFDAPLPGRSTGAPSDWTTAIPDAASDEANTIRRIINRWKPAFAICDRIIILTSGWVLGWPVGKKLGDPTLAKLGGPVVTYWSA